MAEKGQRHSCAAVPPARHSFAIQTPSRACRPSAETGACVVSGRQSRDLRHVLYGLMQLGLMGRVSRLRQVSTALSQLPFSPARPLAAQVTSYYANRDFAGELRTGS